ncbi:MAG: Uma2 family endonuclease [Isosphaeraceae bacterium]
MSTSTSTSRLHGRYGLRSSGMAMTPQQFDETPAWAWDDRYRYELINGVLIVTPPVSDAEAGPNDELGHMLRTYKESHPQGRSLDSTMPERTVPGTPNRRRCDRAIWTGLGRIPDSKTDVPSIVVEFVSSQRRDALRDYELKRDEYMAARVCEYWIIDRFQRIMTVYRNEPTGVVSLIIKETETYRTTLLPGFELPLSRLLAAADELSSPRKKSRKPNPPAGGTDG